MASFPIAEHPDVFEYRVLQRITDDPERGQKPSRAVLLSEHPRRELNSVIGMDIASSGECSPAKCHVELIHHKSQILLRIRLTHYLPDTGAQKYRAAHPPLGLIPAEVTF